MTAVSTIHSVSSAPNICGIVINLIFLNYYWESQKYRNVGEFDAHLPQG